MGAVQLLVLRWRAGRVQGGRHVAAAAQRLMPGSDLVRLECELGDHRNDTGAGWEDYDALENVNLAREGAHADVVAALTAAAKIVWPGA